MTEWPTMYTQTVRQVACFGDEVQLRDGPARELTGVSLAAAPYGWNEVEGRGGSATFARLEQLCYLGGRTPEVLGRVSPLYRDLCYWRGRWPDAYGPRLRGQLRNVVAELSRRPASLRAVALVWDTADVWHALHDQEQRRPVPCTIALQFLVRDAQVYAFATMRSCDAWLGLYYDVPAFAFLGRAVACALNLPFRQVQLSTASLHLYERDREAAGGLGTRSLAQVRPLTHVLVPDRRGPVDPGEAMKRWNALVRWAGSEVDRWAEEHPE